MNAVRLEGFLGGLIVLWLSATMAIAVESPSPPPPSPEVQALIEKLSTLRTPETFAFLETVDPKVIADALQTPEGRWAMDLASRVSRSSGSLNRK